MNKKELATERARLYPSTYSKLQLMGKRAIPRQTIAQVIYEILHKATLYDKEQKKK